MPKFEPLEAGVEVNGQTIRSVIEAFPDTLRGQGEGALANHGIEDPQSGEWYDQSAWLAAFTELYNDIGPKTVQRIGGQIPENADWPPGTETVIDGLSSIQVAYEMNHRGDGDIGEYRAEKNGDGDVTVTCTNPYPCAFDTGLIRAVAKNFGDGAMVTIKEVGDDCRDEGAAHCEYHVSW